MAYQSELGDESKVKVSGSALARAIWKKGVRIAAVAFLLLFVVYFCFAATTIRFIPSTSGTGIQLVKNITNEGGFLDAGDSAMVLPTMVNNRGVGDHLQHAFLPSADYIVVDALTGPHGSFDVGEDGAVIYEGEELGATFSDSARADIESREQTNLEEEYIAECVSGDDGCVEGEALIVEHEHVVGEPVDLSELAERIWKGEEE